MSGYAISSHLHLSPASCKHVTERSFGSGFTPVTYPLLQSYPDCIANLSVVRGVNWLISPDFTATLEVKEEYLFMTSPVFSSLWGSSGRDYAPEIERHFFISKHISIWCRIQVVCKAPASNQTAQYQIRPPLALYCGGSTVQTNGAPSNHTNGFSNYEHEWKDVWKVICRSIRVDNESANYIYTSSRDWDLVPAHMIVLPLTS